MAGYPGLRMRQNSQPRRGCIGTSEPVRFKQPHWAVPLPYPYAPAIHRLPSYLAAQRFAHAAGNSDFRRSKIPAGTPTIVRYRPGIRQLSLQSES